jgi:outer membrane protein OmpA-like peptidoglycan-associated protein
MSSTLIESNKQVFTEDLRRRLSALLGEREPDIHKAIDAANPAILTGILKRIESPDGPMAIYNLAQQAVGNDLHGHFHELSSGSGGLAVGNVLSEKGSEYYKAILGDRTQQMVQEIGRYAGVKADSAAFILGIAAFTSLDAIGRHIRHTNLDVAGTTHWLWEQRDSIVRGIPAGLAVAPALGLKHLPGTKESTVNRRNSIVYGIIALIILLGIIFFVFKTCNRTPAYGPAASDTTARPVTDTAGVADTTANYPVTLPNGTTLNAVKGGTEDQLVAFLNDPNQKIDHKNGNWFNFTKVGFASNSAQLLLESEAQLHNIVAILQAFPKTKIRIGGYTDNTGDSLQNLRLSQDRADSVFEKLKQLGASSHQLEDAKGYGSQYPVGDNGTPDGRRLNRRMALEVREK